MEYLPQNDAEAAELNLAYKNHTAAYVQGRMVRVTGMTRGIPVRYLLEVVEKAAPSPLKPASEMRQAAGQRSGSGLIAERLKVAVLIEEAMEKGQTTVTYYDPISKALLAELVAFGYEVKAESNQGRNETNWPVTINWGKW